MFVCETRQLLTLVSYNIILLRAETNLKKINILNLYGKLCD